MQNYIFYRDLQNNSYFCKSEMHHYALIGRRLGHSYSQRWFEAKFKSLGLTDCFYRLHEMESLDDLRGWVEREGIEGFNVTVPFKQEIIPLLDGLDETAAAIGAVNCVTVRQGRLVGHNTDAPAFRDTLPSEGFSEAYILGTGGAASAVGYALGQVGVPFLFVSRNPKGSNQIGYAQLAARRFSRPVLFVNATPLGMYPDVDSTPLPAFHFSPEIFVYDLTYNPSPTRLMREAAACGATVKDGLEMLRRQAELSWSLYTSKV